MSDFLKVGGPIPVNAGRCVDLYHDVRTLRLAMQKEVEEMAKREAERQDFAVIDQMNQISTKAGLAEFALVQFGIKLNMRDKLEDMRETVTQHITRFGAQ